MSKNNIQRFHCDSCRVQNEVKQIRYIKTYGSCGTWVCKKCFFLYNYDYRKYASDWNKLPVVKFWISCPEDVFRSDRLD